MCVYVGTVPGSLLLGFCILRPKHGLDFTAGREKCLVNRWCSAEGSRVRTDLLLILHFVALNV